METDENSDSMCGDETCSEESNSSDDVTMDWEKVELHPHCCVESKRDFKRMEKKLQGDPYSLNRSQESENQDQPLHVAIYCEHFKCVQYLLEEGADVDRVNQEREKPLERAVDTRCNVETFHRVYKMNAIIKLLLRHGADINYDGNEFPCTHFLTQLIKCEDIDMLKLFLDYGAKTEDLNIINEDIYSIPPLLESLLNCEFKIAKLLFLHGAIINVHKCSNASFYNQMHEPLIHRLIKKVNNENEVNICKVLNIYKQFGGDFYVKYGDKKAIEYLESKIMSSNLNCVLFASLLQNLTVNPLSLQSICRLRVRACMGREYKANIVHLPLPKELKQFLKFKYE